LAGGIFGAIAARAGVGGAIGTIRPEPR